MTAILKVIVGIIIDKLLEKIYQWVRAEYKQHKKVKEQQQKIEKATDLLAKAGKDVEKKEQALDNIISTY